MPSCAMRLHWMPAPTEKTMKSWKPTAEQIANDPSLKWIGYRRGELVWSDLHSANVRFLEYSEGKVRLATLDGIAPLPDLAEENQVRRPSVMFDEMPHLSESEKALMQSNFEKRFKKPVGSK